MFNGLPKTRKHLRIPTYVHVNNEEISLSLAHMHRLKFQTPEKRPSYAQVGSKRRRILIPILHPQRIHCTFDKSSLL